MADRHYWRTDANWLELAAANEKNFAEQACHFAAKAYLCKMGTATQGRALYKRRTKPTTPQDMKITIPSEQLSTRLQNLGRVIGPKSPLPILDNFRLEIHDGVMDIMASDNEISICSTLELTNSEEGQMVLAINARILQDAVKEIPDQPVSITINEETLEVLLEYANGHYQLVGTPADDYPTPPAEEPEILETNIPSDLFIRAVSRSLFAASDDTARPVMNSIALDQHTDCLVVVGSDGHKLAMTTLPGIAAERSKVSIVSKKHAGLIKAALGREVGDVRLRAGNRGLTLLSENYTIQCSLVEGIYPRYSSVIPDNNNNILTINRPALVSALRRVLIMTAGNANSLARLSLSRSNVEVTSQDLDYARSGEENILCEYDGMPMNIGFKGVFLVELLSNMTCEEIIIKLADPSRAAIIVPSADEDNEQILMLIMPMMLAE